MTDEEKDQFQEEVLAKLLAAERRAFVGPLALQLSLTTTDRNAAHGHTIAKNLMDLLGRPRPALESCRRGLLYYDDNQVQALSVCCRPGEQPIIDIKAVPYGTMLEDLALAKSLEDDDLLDDDEWSLFDNSEDVLERLAELRREEDQYRRTVGDDAFEAMITMTRFEAQGYMLGKPQLSLRDLAYLTSASHPGIAGGPQAGEELARMWERTFRMAPFRVFLSELPQAAGTSAIYRQEIDTQLKRFKKTFGWLIDPLIVPVALEVVIKPPSPDRQRGLHDLDNVLREYLVPRVLEILKPPTKPALIAPREAMRRLSPEDRQLWETRRRALPSSPPIGLTHYDAWRLPPASSGAKGFVCLAVVADHPVAPDMLDRIDRCLDRWKESLDDWW